MFGSDLKRYPHRGAGPEPVSTWDTLRGHDSAMPRTTEDHPQVSDPRIDLGHVAQLKRREDAAFFDARPRSRALLHRARGSMPLGVPMS